MSMTTTDPFVAALLQLGTIMAACWAATEGVGNALRAKGIAVHKLAISCLLAPGFSTAAYALGWFTALPAVTAAAIPVAGARGYLSAAFAGLVAALVTSGAHGLVKARRGRNAAPPPAPAAGGGA
jgi:hypothetical protein